MRDLFAEGTYRRCRISLEIRRVERQIADLDIRKLERRRRDRDQRPRHLAVERRLGKAADEYHLKGHEAIQFQMAGLVDDAHAAAAQDPKHFITRNGRQLRRGAS